MDEIPSASSVLKDLRDALIVERSVSASSLGSSSAAWRAGRADGLSAALDRVEVAIAATTPPDPPKLAVGELATWSGESIKRSGVSVEGTTEVKVCSIDGGEAWVQERRSHHWTSFTSDLTPLGIPAPDDWGQAKDAADEHIVGTRVGDPVTADSLPGSKIRRRRGDDLEDKVLDKRKTMPYSFPLPGWWLADGGGLADEFAESYGWRIVELPEAPR